MFQRFRTPTSANITYTGPNQAIGPDIIANPLNHDKFLKNVSGNCVWISLPLQDISLLTNTDQNYVMIYDHTTTSYKVVDVVTILPIPNPKTEPVEKDGHQIVFDFATKEYILRNPFQPYDLVYLASNPNRQWYFNFGNTISTYTANKMTAMPEVGGLTAFNGNSFGPNNNLGADPRTLALTTNNAGWARIPAGAPNTTDFAITFLFKPRTSTVNVQTLCRSDANGIANTINCNYQSSGANFIFTFNYSVTTTDRRVIATVPNSIFNYGNPYIITFAVYENAGHIFLNGLELTTYYTTVTAYARTIVPGENLILFNSSASGSNPENTPSCDFVTASCLKNPTLLDIQKMEGAIRWSATLSGLVPVLAGAHPYANESPRVY